MDLKEETQKRTDLCRIISALSKENDEEALNGLYSELQNLYCGNSKEKFRHFYSDVSSVLQSIQEENKAGLEEIVTNLGRIKETHSNDSEENFCGSLNKLLDHVCLETSRIKSAEEIAKRVYSNEEELKRLNEQLLEKLRENYADLSRNTENLGKKINDIQKQFVAVLGIFASIIMVFSGGISFVNSALSNIANANIFKLIAVSLTVGLVLLNTCYGLFRYIDHFTNSDDKEKRLKPLWKINILFTIATLFFAYLAFGCEKSQGAPSTPQEKTTQNTSTSVTQADTCIYTSPVASAALNS